VVGRTAQAVAQAARPAVADPSGRRTRRVRRGGPPMGPAAQASRLGTARPLRFERLASRAAQATASRGRAPAAVPGWRGRRPWAVRRPIATGLSVALASVGPPPLRASGTTRPKRLPGYPRSTGPPRRSRAATEGLVGRRAGEAHPRRRARASTTSPRRGWPRCPTPQEVGVVSRPAITRETLR
jgi:hypothetical protein